MGDFAATRLWGAGFNRFAPEDDLAVRMDLVKDSTSRSRGGSPSTSWITRLRRRDLLEVVVVFALILAALWSSRRVQVVLGLLTFLWIVGSTLRSRASAAALGLRPAGFRRSLWIVCAALGVAALGIWTASRLHTLHFVSRRFSVESSLLVYLLWALVQQFILQDFFLFRMLRILPKRSAAILVTALLFAIAHIPNPVLTVATLAWGIAACTLFLRYRNLYSLGLAHAILGFCIAIAVPNAIHHQMRVGAGYLEWHAPAHRLQRSHIDQMVSTDAWVMAEATRRCSARHALP